MNPQMRKRLAELFLESGLSATATDDEQNVKQTISVLSQFRSEAEANTVWMRGHFNGYVGDLEWAQEIRENAANIATGIDDTDTVTTFTETDAVPDSTPTEVVENNLDNEPQPSLFSEDTSTLSDLEQMPQTAEEIEAELLKMLVPDVPEFPTDTDVESVFRDQFSLQRLSTAMKTLSQYGPEEGMQRLKEADPEVATHIEQLLQKRQEN